MREDFKRETEFLETLAEIPLEEKQKLGYNISEFILSSVYDGREVDERYLWSEKIEELSIS